MERVYGEMESQCSTDKGDGTVAGFGRGVEVVDIKKLSAEERHVLIEKLIKNIEKDNLQLLQKTRKRLDRVGVKLPTVEVRYRNLSVEAECDVVHGKPLPTLWNCLLSVLCYPAVRLFGFKTHRAKISIINNVSGIIKPGRMNLLLGPPGCGKTSLLKALSANLNGSLKVSGEVSYNGYKLEEFVPQKTSAYISQDDLHIPELTVRETLDFSARCQGLGNRQELMMEVSRREKEAGIVPDPDIDAYMKATWESRTLQTDYILKILGLDICAGTIVGDALQRGISGGQKKRVTTGEIIVGPIKTLFMDEITNGLDSSTAFQIVSCLQQLVHITDATLLVALLQPSPETFELFDDIILMAEGKILYHGPRDAVVEFFESCGFRCPQRKEIVDFLQEVLSKKDQAQYWYNTELPYSYISADVFSENFRASPLRKRIEEDLSEPYDKSQCHKNALSFNFYSVSRWEIFRACMSREVLLMRRNKYLYIFKFTQVVIIAIVTMTSFLKSGMDIDALHANYYLGAIFYAVLILLVDEFSELAVTVSRLSSFYKQKTLGFYPAWAFAIPCIILQIPVSFFQSLVWTSLTYYVIGYSPQVWRFFRQFLVYFTMQVSSASLFRFLASVCQTMDSSIAAATLIIFTKQIVCGFIIPQSSMPSWLRWVFWVSPATYATIGLSGNEFHAPRWQRVQETNSTLGQEILKSHGFDFEDYFFWISIAVLLGFALVWNIGFTLALSFLNPPGSSRVVISHEKLSTLRKGDSLNGSDKEDVSKKEESSKGRMVLPFDSSTLTFQNVQYCVDTPQEMRKGGYAQRKLKILSDITGAARPGVLTALMGATGAGKTTLLDVLAGRKTIGCIEGEIRVNGYPKVQETFVRISGYCEQNDVHSPQITVKESLIFSAWLRLPACIDSKTKTEFVQEVIETIELGGVKDALVGTPGLRGLSTEQRKRLTIAVELVANPSIIFMDEPTTGLATRAAAIVMRAVKNVADTGRTIVCTIHQPSNDIFESFDELIFLKHGGSVIYYGPIGPHSSKVTEYFENIPGVPKIKDNCNPATWILEVASASAERELGIDFAEIYKNSALYENNIELVRQLSNPAPGPGSRELHFPTQFAQNYWGQIKSCLWKLHLSYWRTPSYNLMRFFFTISVSLILGLLFWNQGTKINNQQSLFNIFGSMYGAVIFLGCNSGSAVQPFVATERIIMYRERFAGMYCSWCYTLAQKIPGWWIWMYYLVPTSWTLDVLLTSQFGDVNDEIVVYTQTTTIAKLLDQYFGFGNHHIMLSAVVLSSYPLIYSSLFVFFIKRLNFERR
uniref:ABC transporter domain-containing protein n=1 Tax=Gossypium raimondii TaxID=29730 RepID=A0A0D2V3P7_GOSRA|nr:hypothetical protein B456_012G097300 [Gossypium raimondii]